MLEGTFVLYTSLQNKTIEFFSRYLYPEQLDFKKGGFIGISLKDASEGMAPKFFVCRWWILLLNKPKRNTFFGFVPFSFNLYESVMESMARLHCAFNAPRRLSNKVKRPKRQMASVASSQSSLAGKGKKGSAKGKLDEK